MKKTVDARQMDIFTQAVRDAFARNEDADSFRQHEPGTYTPVIRDGKLLETLEELIAWENADDDES